MRSFAIAVIAAFTLLGAACGSDDESSTNDPDPTTEQSDGAAVDGADDAGGSAPADLGDFAIAVPAGGVVTSDDVTNGARVVFVSMPVSEFDAVVAFYDDWTADQEPEFQRVDAEEGGVAWVTANSSIQVLAPLEGDEQVLIGLTVADG
ncbi:MAG: hypothetical protein OES57_07075 [Acidimicrobiia bacterium]|nr:hypothetical protein [Acidimicrobiia bacterium]